MAHSSSPQAAPAGRSGSPSHAKAGRCPSVRQRLQCVVTLGALLRPDLRTRRQRQVMSGYLNRIGITDFLVIVWAVLGAQLIRFGPGPGESDDVDRRDELSRAWLHRPLRGAHHCLGAHAARARCLRPRPLGHGPEEYKVVATASFRLFAVVGLVSFVLHLDVARGYVAIAMPAGMVGLLVSRWLWRRWSRCTGSRVCCQHRCWLSAIAIAWWTSSGRWIRFPTLATTWWLPAAPMTVTATWAGSRCWGTNRRQPRSRDRSASTPWSAPRPRACAPAASSASVGP